MLGVACVLLAVPHAQSRWVVDVVRVGDPVNEREHDFASDGARLESSDGRTLRDTDGWLRYGMRVYDDSEVTVVCVMRGTEGRRRTFDVLVDGQRVATHTLESASALPVTKEFRVPFGLTREKTRVGVTLRAVAGPTPGFYEVHIVQEHLE